MSSPLTPLTTNDTDDGAADRETSAAMPRPSTMMIPVHHNGDRTDVNLIHSARSTLLTVSSPESRRPTRSQRATHRFDSGTVVFDRRAGLPHERLFERTALGRQLQ